MSDPVPLANMRKNGVRSVHIWCTTPGCHHESTANLDRLDDTVSLASLTTRFRCQRCGMRQAYSMPNWTERRLTGDTAVPPTMSILPPETAASGTDT
jgi:hypothetical protein